MNSTTTQPQADVLIIGAGAAGLLAARELAVAGRTVHLLEARDWVGGRACTMQPSGFTQPVEPGAEFVHGEALLTRALLAEAGLSWQATAGRTYMMRDGQVQDDDEFFAQMPQLLAKLQELTHDLPLADFLHQEFPGNEHAQLRASATQLAEGYDAADAHRVSAWALRDEWAEGGAEDAPRPVGGYGRLLNWLAEQAQAAGAVLHLGAAVQTIEWQPGQATVHTEAGPTYRARQVLCTVPLGVWQRPAGQPGHLRFVPELPSHQQAAEQLGFGSVIKILLEFRQPVWQPQFPDLEFLLSDAPVPTWWSQLPDPRPQLTGWLAGPAAQRLSTASDEEILHLALSSLAPLLGLSLSSLREQLCGSYVCNWGAKPYAYGAYSYATLGATTVRAALAAPVANTLFFAGEGLYDGPAMGTVEAALVSGQAAARAMLAQYS